MRLLHRLGWIAAAFAVVVLIGQISADWNTAQARSGFLSGFGNSQGIIFLFIQVLWCVFLAGSIAMAKDHYWGRWAVALSALLILCELTTFEVLPASARGWQAAVEIMSVTWPGVSMGRGPLAFLILMGLTYTVIVKGLARRPSSVRRGPSGDHLRTRETDSK